MTTTDQMCGSIGIFPSVRCLPDALGGTDFQDHPRRLIATHLCFSIKERGADDRRRSGQSKRLA